MDNMIERVAKVIFSHGPKASAWEDVPQQVHELYRDKARAAINAMRYPTMTMIRAASAFPDSDGALYALPGRMLDWQAMIDAALNDG